MHLPQPRLSALLFVRLTLALLISILFLIVGVPKAIAQVDRAELEGTVTDPSGSVITSAHVKVVANDTGLSEEQQTNSKGYYRFPGLAVGTYTLTTSGPGFKTKLVDDVVNRIPGLVAPSDSVHASRHVLTGDRSFRLNSDGRLRVAAPEDR